MSGPNMINARRGFAPIIVILIVVAVLGAGAGGYVYVSKKGQRQSVSSQTPFPAVEQAAPVQKPVPVETPIIEQPPQIQKIAPPVGKQKYPELAQPSTVPTPVITPEVIAQTQKIYGPFIGLWKAEKLLGFNPETGVWEESKLVIDMFFEFKEDGKSCGGWDLSAGFKCTKYDTYSVSGDIINVTQIGVTGPPWHYKWNIAGGKLELTSEIFQEDHWIPFIKYIAGPASVGETLPPAKTDFTPPQIQSFEIIVAVNPATGKREATLKCRATDNIGIKYIWINLQYAGENINWAHTPQIDDANVKDQTWTASGFDAEKPGTHEVTCHADDAANNQSPEVEKTFTVP